MSDVLTSYENGLQVLLQKLGKDTTYYGDALVYQARLSENIGETRRYGDTEIRRAERYQIIRSLNDLANNALGISFNELSRATIQAIDTSGRHHHELCQMDWGEAPYTEQFYGREQERAILERGLVDDHCRVIAVVGIGGIGKTSLVAKLIEQIKNEFEYIFWRSLQNAPTLENILEKCILFLSNQQLRSLFHDKLRECNLLNGFEGRNVRQTAHASLIVYSQPLQFPTSLVEFIENNRQTEYGTALIRSIEVVRYQRTAFDVKLITLGQVFFGK